jgi:hypothetical protein
LRGTWGREILVIRGRVKYGLPFELVEDICRERWWTSLWELKRDQGRVIIWVFVPGIRLG